MKKGAFFLMEETLPNEIFTPEDFTEEHLMVAKTARDFVAGEVVPNLEALEHQEEGLMPKLLKSAGELGLLGADIGEEYDGSGLDKICSLIITENIVEGGSFSLGHGAHTGIGALPIVFFGNEEQKKKYLPGLASGELFAAYCLTEPGAGSDALASKSKAVLNPEGTHYILNGAKQFITNGGFADILVTYAKVDGEKFTAFIVESKWDGVSTGPEEKKMGIKGSSTRTINYDNVMVPVENVLGTVGKGHQIAFNILNIGRLKLALGCLGSSKLVIKESARYALERKQFNLPIAKFGMIREKLAKMAVKTYLSESAVYRTGGLIEDAMSNIDKTDGAQLAKSIEEYAIECSINKIFASEVLDFVADEGVQVHGGYGYINEYPVERIYRDARINRIFEGTNEINRLVIAGTLFKMTLQGKLPMMEAGQKLKKELMMPLDIFVAKETLDLEKRMIEKSKKAFTMVAGLAAEKYGEKLTRKQEILDRLANMVIDIFAMESAVLRALKAIANKGEAQGAIYAKLAQAGCYDLYKNITLAAEEVLAEFNEGDVLQTQLAMLTKLLRPYPFNIVGLHGEIADMVLQKEAYPLS